MNRYQEVNKEKLTKLRDGLDILEDLDPRAVSDLDLVVYGITHSEAILDAARESIADESGIDESDVSVSDIAVAIPITSSSIKALTGSGIRLKDEVFAYQGKEGEGIKTQTFVFSGFKPPISFSDITVFALAISDSWLTDFLKQYGGDQPAQIKESVHRDEEAITPDVPVSPEIRKKTHLITAIENFLG